MAVEEMMKKNVQDAVLLAIKHHAGVYRKYEFCGAKIPFISHPLEVMKLVWKWGAGIENNLMAAVCHDLKEDTDITWEEMLAETNEEVVSVVKELTFDPFKQSKPEYMASFDKKSVDALIIKLADRLINILDFAHSDFNYAKKYMQKAAALFISFCRRIEEVENAFGKATIDSILDAMEEVSKIFKNNDKNSKTKVLLPITILS